MKRLSKPCLLIMQPCSCAKPKLCCWREGWSFKWWSNNTVFKNNEGVSFDLRWQKPEAFAIELIFDVLKIVLNFSESNPNLIVSFFLYLLLNLVFTSLSWRLWWGHKQRRKLNLLTFMSELRKANTQFFLAYSQEAHIVRLSAM